jgi:hypothetical protein
MRASGEIPKMFSATTLIQGVLPRGSSLLVTADVAADEARAVRAKCKSMLKDMLLNTCFIVNRADPILFRSPCRRGDHRAKHEEREINRCAGEVVRKGTSLIFHLRWAMLRLAFNPPLLKSCRQTLKAAEKYACLWMALIRLIEAEYPEFREKLAMAD